MTSSSPLLSLPTEIREAILRYAFNDISTVRVRTPTHRRLRPARIDKKCPQGLLSTCHTLREEAIPVFYSSTTVIFHSSSDAVEYLQDPQVDPFVKSNLTHLAMDDGDCQCMVSLPRKHLWLVSNAFDLCEALKAIEFRIYSRHDNPAVVAAVRNLISDWRALAANCNVSVGDDSIKVSKQIKLGDEEPTSDTLDRLMTRHHGIRIAETQATYNGGMVVMSNSPTIHLSCCNIVVDKEGSTTSVLGDAKEAVERRKVRVGATRPVFTDYEDTRCPARTEVQFMKDVEESLRSAREAAQRGVGRYAWSTSRMSVETPTVS